MHSFFLFFPLLYIYFQSKLFRLLSAFVLQDRACRTTAPVNSTLLMSNIICVKSCAYLVLNIQCQVSRKLFVHRDTSRCMIHREHKTCLQLWNYSIQFMMCLSNVTFRGHVFLPKVDAIFCNFCLLRNSKL